MIKYIHGSEDSLDKDVIYVFDGMPSFKECQELCASKEENRNIIVVQNGIVNNCFKGTVDEINNGLYYTYSLHKQEHPLIIEKLIERDTLIKCVRVLRCLLSHCSRTQYRDEVKKAMRSSSWKERISITKTVNYLALNDYDKNGTLEDVLKIFAFQLVQSLELFKGNEIYTKSSAANFYPDLRKYLYREKSSYRKPLMNLINYYLNLLDTIIIEEKDGLCHFVEFSKIIDLKTEQYKGE
jgi:hypothetical protein